jgi:hypothetical protein
VAVALAANGVWLITAAESIRHSSPEGDVRGALAYVGKHPHIRFKLSPQVTSIATQQHLAVPPNAHAETGIEQVVFFPRAEAPDIFGWKTNDPWFTKAVFGPREVNFNWYSGWMGPDRVVIMTKDKALAGAAGISFVK